MTTILVFAAAAIAITWLSHRFVSMLESDGLGHRPVPRSHHDEEEAPQDLSFPR